MITKTILMEYRKIMAISPKMNCTHTGSGRKIVSGDNTPPCKSCIVVNNSPRTNARAAYIYNIHSVFK